MLCQVLTQPTVRMLILGRSEAPELPSNALITATGNNLVVVGDLTRRTLSGRLDPKCERPELREFANDPVDIVRANRGRYVAAALTILRAYHAAGQPQQRMPLGSFSHWSRTVRDPLLWLGLADPVDTIDEVRKSDQDLQTAMEIMAHWWALVGNKAVTARELVDYANERNMLAAVDSRMQKPHLFRHPDFRDALLAIAGEHGAPDSGKLGYWLRRMKDRIVGEFQIVCAGTNHKTARWQLRTSSSAREIKNQK